MKTFGLHRRLIISDFIGWTLFSVFFALQSYVNSVYFGQPQSFLTTLAVWLICGCAWMFLTPPVFICREDFLLKAVKSCEIY